jgi:hypothetical protein
MQDRPACSLTLRGYIAHLAIRVIESAEYVVNSRLVHKLPVENKADATLTADGNAHYA